MSDQQQPAARPTKSTDSSVPPSPAANQGKAAKSTAREAKAKKKGAGAVKPQVKKPKVPKRHVRKRAKGRPRIYQDELEALAMRSDVQIAEYIRRLLKDGRPPKAINPAKVLQLRACGCSMEEIAAYLGCERTLIEKQMKRDPLLRRMFDEGEAYGKAQIRSAQHIRAITDRSDTMLIWVGKNRLGQKDDPSGQAPGQNHLADVMEIMRMAKGVGGGAATTGARD